VYQTGGSVQHRVGTGIFEFDREQIYAPVITMRRYVLVLSLVILVFAFGVSWLLAQRMSRPIEKLTEAATKISQGDLGIQLSTIPGGEIGQLSRIFNDMSQSLQQMEIMRSSQAALSRELEIARGIQLAVLPANGNLGPYDFHGYMQTADAVGGDYYDCIHLKYKRKDYWWCIIGDVSGHGLPSGLIMLMAQTAIRTVLELSPGLTPDEAFVVVNQVLYDNIQRLHENKYMTATFYRLDSSGQVLYAGLHLDTILYRKKSAQLEIRDSRGMWLGIESDIKSDIKLDRCKLNKGDMLLLYTDGIIEAFNQEKEMYSEDRLLAIMNTYGDQPLAELQNNLVQDLEQFCNGRQFQDDVSFAMIRRN
ncbi:MAG: SpoIIE family protein phosphatase, partial [Leptospiraceae bacterium]|nr:SpoIIE family protein phosphatase [Leptospiraceae bacterium]